MGVRVRVRVVMAGGGLGLRLGLGLGSRGGIGIGLGLGPGFRVQFAVGVPSRLDLHPLSAPPHPHPRDPSPYSHRQMGCTLEKPRMLITQHHRELSDCDHDSTASADGLCSVSRQRRPQSTWSKCVCRCLMAQASL